MTQQTEVHSNLLAKTLKLARYPVAVIILVFLFKRFFGLLDALQTETISFRPSWLLISIVLLIVCRASQTFPWFVLYQKICHKPVSFLSVWILLQLSELGKYVPGKVGQFVGIVSLCGNLRISKTEAIVSQLMHSIFQCASGILIGIPVLFFPASKEVLYNLMVNITDNFLLLICIPIVIGVMATAFFILFQKRHLFTKRYLLKGMKTIFSIRMMLPLIGGHLLLWSCLGVAFFLFIKGIYPVYLTQLPIIIGIYPLAWSIGFMSLITPSGLGVREGILSVLLVNCLPPAAAILMALLSRLWGMCADILMAGAAGGCYFRQKR